MKLSDYVAKKVVEFGVKHVFMVTGGGSMHLNYSLGRHPELECIFNHHEQACAMGAEAYYRLSNRLSVVNVTTGPGCTNAITGVYGAWTDSIGMVVISGQVKYETTIVSTGLPIRQYGDQEIDIVTMVRSITKYVVMITDPKTIRYHLEKAFYLATHGRPGPCWLDIPLDVQAAEIIEGDLISYEPEPDETPKLDDNLPEKIRELIRLLQLSKRPVILAGGGVRLSGAHADFMTLVERLGVPVATAWNAHDVIENNHSLYIGRPGTVGDRSGNFVVQSSDLLIVMGSRLNIRQVSYNWKSFARKAFKVWVDIDEVELKKPSVNADLPIVSDLRAFIRCFLAHEYPGPTAAHLHWLSWGKARQARYPVVLPDYWKADSVNPYCFMDTLFSLLEENQVIVSANGSACVTSFQAAFLKRGQRLWTNSGCASMGYELPAAIGACKANGNKSVICLAGDGSIMMNLQELQTIASLKLPIKIFLLNNSGYVSIFQTQKNFFDGDEVGAGPKSGVKFPSFEKIARSFEIDYLCCATHKDMKTVIQLCLETVGPSFCEIYVDKDVTFAPKLAARRNKDGTISSPPLEDLSPFLSREELESNVIIDNDAADE